MSEVKTNSILNEEYKAAWLVYFMVSIGLIGFITGYVLATPFFLLAFVIPWLRPLPGRIMCFGVTTLLKAQPWLNYAINEDELKKILSENKGRPLLFLSNHRSHLDAFFLLAYVPNIRILAKKSLFYILPLGWMMLMMRQIPVGRKNAQELLSAMEKVDDGLKNCDRVHIFPEMTRAELGFQGVQRFSLLPFATAIKTKALIVPVVFQNTDVVWPKSIFGVRANARVQVRFLEPVETTRFSEAQALMEEVREKIKQGLLCT